FHQAVGIKDDEVFVELAGGLDEIGDVARLLSWIGVATPVENVAQAAEFLLQPNEPQFFKLGHFGIVGVGQDCKVKLPSSAEAVQAVDHRGNVGESLDRILVVDRNKHSCLDRRNIAARFRLDAAPPEESVDAEDRAPSKPSGGDGKQTDANEVQPLGAVGKEIAGAQKARGECHDERKQDRHQSPKEHHHQALSIDETRAVFNEPPASGIVDAGG